MKALKERDSSAGLEKTGGHVRRLGGGYVARDFGKSLESENGPQMTASKKMGTSILQPQTSEFCQQSHEFRRGADLQEEI